MVLAGLSGTAALAHELVWTRRLIDLLGASGASSSRVFGAFFLGLALGSAWASRRVDRVSRPWRAAALAEAAIMALAIPAFALTGLTDWIWPALGPEGLLGWPGGVVKLLVSLLVITPPAAAMGAVLPFLAAAVLDGPFRLGRHGNWLYGVNTLGGLIGLVATSLLTLPRLGASGALLTALGLNVAVAAGFAAMDRLSRPKGRERGVRAAVAPEPSTQGVPGRFAPGLPEALAFGSGAGILAIEVIAMPLVMLNAPLSFHAPAAVLAVVLLLLGLASLIAPALIRACSGTTDSPGAAPAGPGLAGWMPGLLLAAGLATVATPILFLRLAEAWGDLGGGDLSGFLGRLTLLVLLSLGGAVGLAGLVFPATLALSEAEAPRSGSRPAGGPARRLGRLLAWNGVGGLLGAEAAYRLLLPSFGIHAGLAVVGGLYLLAGFGLAVRRWLDRETRASTSLVRPIGALLIGVSLATGIVRQLPHVNPYLGFRVIDEQYGREGAVAVVDQEGSGRAILLSNQYVLGGTEARAEQERQAHLPLVLHPEPRQVAFIGLATGITPGAALEHSVVESVTAIELSPLVVRAAERHFGDFNHDLARSDRVRVVPEDGRTYLASTRSRFDLVVGDLFLPWGPGEGRLFSREHFESVRASLRPGGVFAQWLPMFQLTPGQFALIADTFGSVFPRVELVRLGFGADRPAVALVGFAGDRPSIDWAAVERRCAEARRDGIGDPTVRHAEVVAMLSMGAWDRSSASPALNTLGNVRLEIDAGRERVTGKPGRKYYFGDRWIAFLRDRIGPAAVAGGVDAGDWPARLPGLRALGMSLTLAERRPRPDRGTLDDDAAATLPDDLARALPGPLIRDTGADLRRWPGLPWPATLRISN